MRVPRPLVLLLILAIGCDRAATTVDQDPAQVVFSETCPSGYAFRTGQCAPLPSGNRGAATGPDGFATCTPSCQGKTCGEDECGGYCGVCEAHYQCLESKCSYVPWCGDGSCTPDESCQSCPGDCACGAAEQCVAGACCTPATCADKAWQCGSPADGCGGTLSCGTCSTVLPNTVCTQDHLCQCQPNCTGKSCGDDGCNGSCGGCPESYQCQAGTCVYQVACGNGQCDVAAGEDCQTCPDCVCPAGSVCKQDGVCCQPTTCALLGKTCGTVADGCGGQIHCGDCATYPSSFCNGATCECTPDCTGKVCGSDGCGGSCGACDKNYACTLAGKCDYQPWCGDNVCDLALGEGCSACLADCGCSSDQQCMASGTCCTPATCQSLGVSCGTHADTCGGTLACGACEAFPNSYCSQDGQCACEPGCTGKTCGADGCGAVCGTCEAGEICGATSQCEPVGCLADTDCEAFGKVCDTLTKGCVECLAPSDCGPGAWACADNDCQKKEACTSDVDCPSQVCLVPAGYCVDCLAHADCGPAALCAEYACIPAPPCQEGAGCQAPLVCDAALGKCVACAKDEDCPADHLCDQEKLACEPILPCAVNAQCTAQGLVCDTAAGYCVQCILDAECPVEYHCDLGKCQLDVCGPGDWACSSPKTLVKCNFNGSAWVAGGSCGPGQYCADGDCRDQVCAPGEVKCADNAVVQCNDLGSTWVVLTECGAKAVCFEADCHPSVCDPFQLACADDYAWVKCDILGIQWSELVPCAGGLYCGAEDKTSPKPCKPMVCEPGALYCKSELEAAFCNAKGSGPQTIVPCAPGTACATDTCEPVICDPMTKLCEDQTAKLCNAFGTAWKETLCLSTQYCQGGECHPQVCQPGTKHCGGNLLLTCDALGKEEASLDCGATGVCLSDACVPKVCVPLQRVCIADQQAYAECNELGTVMSGPVDCPPTTYCDQGICEPEKCPPGAFYCSPDDTDVHFCNALGSGDKTVYPCPTASICDNAACAPLLCEPDAYFCDGATVKLCNALGTASQSGATCPQGYVCEEGACEKIVCAPTAFYCDGDVAAKCNGLGTGNTTQSDCEAQGQLCENGICMDPLCEPATTFCSQNQVLQCNAKGTGTTPGPVCTATQNCVEDGLGHAVCEDTICAPGVLACQGPKVVECSELGTQWQEIVNCTALGQYCDAGFCHDIYPCGSVVFDGVNDQGATSDNDATENWTAEVWFSSTSSTAGATLFRNGQWNDGSKTDHSVRLYSTAIYFDTGYATAPDACTNLQAPVAAIDGKWHHLAVTLQRSSNTTGAKAIFFDGVLVKSCNYTDRYPGSAKCCPDNYWVAAFPGANFEGKLAELRYSSSVRYTKDFVPSPFLIEDASAYRQYHFNDGQGTSAAPVPGAGGPIALSNGPTWTSDDPACMAGSLCGDGIQVHWEPCDDGNNDDGDGCAWDCQVE